MKNKFLIIIFMLILFMKLTLSMDYCTITENMCNSDLECSEGICLSFESDANLLKMCRGSVEMINIAQIKGRLGFCYDIYTEVVLDDDNTMKIPYEGFGTFPKIEIKEEVVCEPEIIDNTVPCEDCDVCEDTVCEEKSNIFLFISLIELVVLILLCVSLVVLNHSYKKLQEDKSNYLVCPDCDDKRKKAEYTKEERERRLKLSKQE